MTRLDTYILRQIAGPFVFFVLVFTGVIWLSQSLRVIDTVVNNGQSAHVFLEFTALLLPTVFSIVLPVSAFAAVLYAVNRLFTDSELVVLFAAGVSGQRILRPVAVFSLIVMAALFLNALALMPISKRVMQERVNEVRGDIAAAFLREGEFVSPAPKVTVYLRQMGRPGEMLGLFVHDERDPDQIVTYTAERAVIVTSGRSPTIVMFDGLAQSKANAPDAPLSVLRFERLSYDLDQLAPDRGPRQIKPSELFVAELLTAGEGETGPYNVGEYRAEGHEALAGPLYALALPLLGTALIVSFGFRRQGFAGRVVAAAGIALMLRLLGLAAKSATGSAAMLWPLMYAPPVIGILAALVLMSGQGLRPRSPRMRAGPEAPGRSGEVHTA
ncbi:MAG: LPS export ABC transporter permease LptF [Pikeienuella sp.]